MAHANARTQILRDMACSDRRRRLRSREEARALRYDDRGARRLPRQLVRRGRADVDRGWGRERRLVFGAAEGGAVLVAVVIRRFRQRRGFMRMTAVVLGTMIVSVTELPVLTADFV